jgi:hypothetical protein
MKSVIYSKASSHEFALLYSGVTPFFHINQ